MENYLAIAAIALIVVGAGLGVYGFQKAKAIVAEQAALAANIQRENATRARISGAQVPTITG